MKVCVFERERWKCVRVCFRERWKCVCFRERDESVCVCVLEREIKVCVFLRERDESVCMCLRERDESVCVSIWEREMKVRAFSFSYRHSFLSLGLEQSDLCCRQSVLKGCPKRVIPRSRKKEKQWIFLQMDNRMCLRDDDKEISKLFDKKYYLNRNWVFICISASFF